VRLSSALPRFALVAALASLTVSCASSRGVSAQQRSTPRKSAADLITREEIDRGHWQSAYELIEALRPRWLHAHGPDSILGETSDVQVHIDENRLGGVNALRGIATTGITSIRFIDPVTAAARWGGDHANGAIVISTKS
jgi:hypothetical protein